MSTHRYLLASASPRRKELIALLPLDAVQMPSGVEETFTSDDPVLLVKTLSRQKAEDVAKRAEKGDIIIGCDTCVQAAGKILGKPATHEEAADMIRLLSGRTHRVFTGVCVIVKDDKASPVSFVEETLVTVYPMSEEEILAYAESDEPMDKAGAYGIQGDFCRYIERIEGDYFNVVGLPVGRLYQTLKQMTGGIL